MPRHVVSSQKLMSMRRKDIKEGKIYVSVVVRTPCVILMQPRCAYVVNTGFMWQTR